MTIVSPPSAPTGSERRPRSTVTALLLASTAIGSALFAAGAAGADVLPTDGSVVAGSANIGTPSAGQMTINQGSDRAVINWGSFSIGAGNGVTINQPTSNSALLNRVTGALPSTLDGSLTANGEVYLVNPNGVILGQNGTVEAGGFVASTLDIGTQDFMNGRLSLRPTAAPPRRSRTAAPSPSAAAAMRRFWAGGCRTRAPSPCRWARWASARGRRRRWTCRAMASCRSRSRWAPTATRPRSSSSRAASRPTAAWCRSAPPPPATPCATPSTCRAWSRPIPSAADPATIMLGGGAGGVVHVSGRLSASSPTLAPDSSPRPPDRPDPGGSITVTGHAIDPGRRHAGHQRHRRRRQHPGGRRLAGRRQPATGADHQRRLRHHAERQCRHQRRWRQGRDLVGEQPPTSPGASSPRAAAPAATAGRPRSRGMSSASPAAST